MAKTKITPLTLTKADAVNYDALQRLLQDIPLEGQWRVKRISFSKLTQAKQIKMLDKQDYRCLDCAKEFGNDKGQVAPTVEHVLPHRYGSENNEYNLVLLCEDCNTYRDQNFSIDIVKKHFGSITSLHLDEQDVIISDNDETAPKLHSLRLSSGQYRRVFLR